MLPDRVSNPGPLTYESGALPTALRGPALLHNNQVGIIGNIIYFLTYFVRISVRNLVNPII